MDFDDGAPLRPVRTFRHFECLEFDRLIAHMIGLLFVGLPRPMGG